MDRKMRAARNNAAAKARKRAVERRAAAPRCESCGEPDSEHVYAPIPVELAEAIKEAGVACEVVPVPPKQTQH